MFVRIKDNKSGSQSVLLVHGERMAGKKHPLLRVVRNFGTGEDPQHLQQLIAQAEAYKQQLLNAQPLRKPLKITAAEDIRSCTSCNCGFNDVYGTAFNRLFAHLPLKPQDLQRIRNLTVMRIAESASKRRTAAIAAEYGLDLALESIYKTMDQLTDKQIAQIQAVIYNHTRTTLMAYQLEVDVMFYDLTTISFENNSQDTLRNFGFSKDGKHQHVQVMMALIVTRHGLPIGYELFPGNSYEGHSLIPVLTDLRQKYAITRVVLVADSALMNRVNVEELQQHNFEYVIAARLKNSQQSVKKQVLAAEGYQSICTISAEDGNEEIISAKAIATSKTNMLMCYYSSKRARKDAHDREKAIEKAKNYLRSSNKGRLTKALQKPYVKLQKEVQSEITIDAQAIAEDQQWDGYFALQTNIKDASAGELLEHYRGLWQVEQSFRLMKHNLEIRPVYHYTKRRIKAHFILCYMALSLMRQVEFKLRMAQQHLPLEQLHLSLRKMRRINLTTREGYQYSLLEDPPLSLIPIYQTLGLKWPVKFQPITTL